MDRLIKLSTNQVRTPDWKIHNSLKKEPNKIAGVQASVQQHGQLQPIHVYKKEEQFLVLDGRKVLYAMQQIGAEEVDAIYHNVAESEAKMISLSLNFTSGTMDEVDVGEIIHNLLSNYKSDTLANKLPFGLKTIKHYDKLFSFVWEEFIDAPSDDGQIGLF